MNKIFKGRDPILLLIVGAIFVIALFSLYSASHCPGSSAVKNFSMQQIVWFGLAAIISIMFIALGYEKWLDYSYVIFGLNLFLLVLVLLVGNTHLGAKRWLSLGLFSLQPSEFCKISFILVFARFLSDNSGRLDSFKTILLSLLLCMVPFLLILKQPDLGTALVFLPIFFVMIFVAGAKIKHLIILVLTGSAALPFMWSMLKVYQRKRLLVFLNPNIDPLGAGYTIIQSKIAVGSGGLFGKGWLSGTQNQLNFLPERHTDFIFSVIGEEWGFAGSVILLGLFLLLVKQLLYIANTTNDQSGKLLITGIITLIWFQVFVNIAMTIGLMPVVGLPLPLVSYGGSNLMTIMVLISLAISVNAKRKIF
ncbi:MAG: rod shape-determining protein RodA [Candidatus Orphnella occulta]|nr:rod shape-determining protein RodA [Candidatus Orphnella occulta]